MDCRTCGRKLTGDEIGIHLKLIGRNETSCFCKICLAARLKCRVEDIDRKIQQFRDAGCYLFP
ncbi:MAG: hypothetical protein E7618_01870 [Ruminococcaceae bacterium]|nr:hypothetical protein [Oscillospiraceae bacterium]